MIFSRCGITLGIGCACNYHTGVQMLNLVVGSKRNAVWNGISLAGNTIGAIAVFHLMGNAFEKLHYGDSLFYLSFGIGSTLMIFTLIYLIPQRFISKYQENEEEENKANADGKKWFEEIFDLEIMTTTSYWMLIVSQCLNAIGFLNLTTFLNAHLYQTMGYDNIKTAFVLTVMQVCDCLGRFFLTYLADKCNSYCKYSIHLFYIVGTLGNGACMIALKDVDTEAGVYLLLALMGLFARYAFYKSIYKV